MSMNVKMLFIEVAYADPQNPILKILFKVFICGEYRSRTDDLLRARQAL
jgi:hypothetical protein